MKSIRTFLIMVIMGITLLVFSIQTYVSVTNFKEHSFKQIEEKLLLQVSQESASLYTPIKEVADESIAMGNIIVTMPEYREDNVFNYLMKALQKNKIIAGAGMAFEPSAYQQDVKKHYPYVMKDKNGTPALTWEYNDIEYQGKGWYKMGLNSSKAVEYTEPYPDSLDPDLIWITCVHPLEKNGRRIGVSEADFTLDGFKKTLMDIKVGQNGYAFAITKTGLVIGNHTGKGTEQEKALTVKITDAKDADWKALGERMLTADKPGIMKIKDNYTVFSPIGDTGMTLVFVYPISEVAAGLNKLLYLNIGLVSFFVVLFVAVLSYIINRRIVNPLKRLSETANKMAAGDLSPIAVKYTGNDEIGVMLKAFVTMNEHLRSTVMQVANVAEQLSASSEELHATSYQSTEAANDIEGSTNMISGKAGGQAEAVVQALNAVEMMTATISAIAENANTMSAKSVYASREAESGSDAVDAANQQMQSISQTVSQSAQLVRQLGDNSKQIGEIVSVISGIAGQTNLLALNAAIEAARAGEQGRGFAVVADEVRKLAEQSQLAAQKISVIIADIQRETDVVVTVMNQGTQEVSRGADVISATGERFQKIVTQVRSLNNDIQEIASAAQEAMASSNHVVTLVGTVKNNSATIADDILTISAATEEQSAAMTEITTSSESLAKLAEKLNLLMGHFKV